MDNQKLSELIIMKNILFLVKQSKKSELSQRNLLNKWFQDSIKSYILEQVAFPFFGKYLNCKNSTELRAFMSQKEVGKYKPKYMEIIEQYFYYINQFNLRDVFIQKLNSIILDPKDITQTSQSHYHSYNCQKLVRKQFVCLLILRFFEYNHKIQFTSFYDLWNFCFPEAVQKKKKLSKYDTKSQKQQSSSLSENTTKDTSYPNLSVQLMNETSFSSPFSPNIKLEYPSSDFNSLIINNLNHDNVKVEEQILQQNEKESLIQEKQQIKSGILEEDDDEEEEMINLSDQLSFQQQNICKKEEEPQQCQNVNSENSKNDLEQNVNQNQYIYTQQIENPFYYQMQYYYYLPAQQFNQYNAIDCKIETKQEDLNQPIFQQN
ncbi:hypothetical protein ABPG73_022954 [Tetrahymena malaccensis]